jgi:hypothetical protein
MGFLSTLLTGIAAISVIAAALIYFFGIPVELKRAMEKKALETMGENKASYVLKSKFFSFILS